MTILELFKKVDPSVLAAKMIFKHLKDIYPVLIISDIADTSSGGTPNRGMIEYYNGDIPWVKSGELKDGLITKCDEYITEAGLKNSSAKLFPKGTLLVAMYGANIGKTGVLDFDATTNQAVCAIFPKIEISKDFLFWYFKQQRIDFIAIGKGGAQPNISQTVINNASIVVPDVKTQKLIVDFLERIERGNGIDEKFFIPEVLKDVEQIYKYKNSYVDLTDSFENQLVQLQNLNQAILQEAVQGKLLSESELAELKNEPDYEPAQKLLERIQAEKEQQQAQKSKGEKQNPENPKILKILIPTIKNEEIPFEIPKNWVWCTVPEMAANDKNALKAGPFGSSLKKIFYVKNGYKIYGQEQVIKQDPHYGDYFINEERFQTLKSCEVKPGDILISLVGTMGKVLILPDDIEPGIINPRLVKISLYKTIDRDYFRWFFYSPVALKQIKHHSHGSTMDIINLGIISKLLIPLPPLSEQTRIVAEIEKQLAKTKQLKEHIIANQHATEQLLKALLHAAFEVQELNEK